MIEYLVCLCAILISGVILIEWYDLFFERKINYQRILFLILEYVCICLAVRVFLKEALRLERIYVDMIRSYVEILIEWILFVRQYKGGFLKKFIVYICCMIFWPGFEVYVFSSINSQIISASKTNTFIAEINNFSVQIVTYILILIVGGIIHRKKYKSNNFYLYLFIALVFFQFILHYIFEEVFLVSVNSQNMNMYLLAYGFSVVVFFCICVIYRKHVNDTEHRRMEKERLDFYKLQYGHYHETREHLNELKGIKHDFRKHMIVLKSLSQENRQEELDQYIDDMESQISLSTEIVDAKNSVISAQLTHVKELCRKNEIFFDYILEYEQINIVPFDLNTIIGNMLDNAVEASLQIQEKNLRRIQIMIQSQKGMVMIACKNNYQGELRKNNNHILTSKKESQKHGFGIQNIRDTVKKYDGKVDITTENQEFYISALFRNLSNGNTTNIPNK